MEILVLFIKKIEPIDIGIKHQIISIIKNNANAYFEEFSDNNLLEVMKAKMPNEPDETEVVVLISGGNIGYDFGAKLARFKKNLIKEFSAIGLNLNNNSLQVHSVKDNLSEYVKNANEQEKNSVEEKLVDYENMANQFVPKNPLYSFERVILPKNTVEKIINAVGVMECEQKVFKEWGLYEIQPHPSTALSFYGAPGTGKTMAAEAVAERLGKKILKVSYADVESKYHGEGPKVLKAIFLAAENNDAVLFFDEADSLLSKRLTNVSQGSEQAINSLRSQLLICLEEFKGIVIFATNLVVNYDKAFLTRLISIKFDKPDIEARKQIWSVHVKAPDDGKEHQLNIPLSIDVDIDYLAEKYEFVGREIRNAVIKTCVNVALDHKSIVTQNDFIKVCDELKLEQDDLEKAQDYTDARKSALGEIILKKIKESEGKEDVSNVDK